MPIGDDAVGGYTFKIEIDGTAIAQFKEVSGLECSVEVIEKYHVNMAGKMTLSKTMGNQKFGDITLKRGVTDSDTVWKWFKTVSEGKVDEARKNGSIVAYGYAGEEVLRWNFERAWPSKVSASGMDATSTDLLMEEMTLVVEHLALA